MNNKKTVCRDFEHCEPETFKQALVCAVQHHKTLELKDIAQAAGMLRRDLYAYCQAGAADIPAEKLAKIIAVTGRVDLIRFLLAPIGYTVVPLSESVASDRVLQEVFDVQDAAGELSKASRPLAGGHALNEEQLNAVERGAMRVQNEAAEVVSAVRSHRPVHQHVDAIGVGR